MSNSGTYIKDDEHYQMLASMLSPGDARAYTRTKHGRVITGSPGWELVVYRMVERKPSVLTRISFIDLSVDSRGVNTEVVDLGTNERLVIGHSPQRLFDYPVFMSIPFCCEARYRVKPGEVEQPGILTWPVYIRTESRRHLRELGVTYCETKRSFAKEFEAQSTE